MTTLRDLAIEWNGKKITGVQTRLAKAVGTTQNNVSAWFAGRHLPSEDVRPKLAKILGVSIEKLEEIIADKPQLPSGRVSIQYIPVLGIVAAERFSFSFSDFPEERLPITSEPGKQLFALLISGNCMEPNYKDCTYVIVNPDQMPREGKVVLAYFDGEYTLKRLTKNKKTGKLELTPDNKNYSPIPIDSNKLEIRGVVVGSYRKE